MKHRTHSENHSPTRRKFCKWAGLALALASAAALAAPALAQASLSPPTPSQVEGPYFLPDSPFRSNLIPNGMKGQETEVSGGVFDQAGKPIAGAILSVWLASPSGKYDNQDAAGNPISIPPAQHVLRGRITADAVGYYSFTCLRPGNYSIGGGVYRPAHIHVKVEAPGFQTLITQLYFPDDRFNLKDLPGSGFFKPELLVSFDGPTAPQPNVVLHGSFHFVLAK